MGINPNEPVMNLDLQKTQTWVAPAKLMYQGDSGYMQPFRLTNGWSQYDVTADKLAFSATKPDGNLIQIENEAWRFNLENGIWYFALPDELTQATGNVPAFFYVKDDDNHIVASTTKFSYQVEAKFTDEENSISYVTALEHIQKVFEEYIENAKENMNTLNQSSIDNVNQSKERLEQTEADWNNQLSAIKSDITSQKNAWEQYYADVQSKWNEIVQDNNENLTEWNSKHQAAINDFYSTSTQTITDTVTELRNSVTTATNAAVDEFKREAQVKFQDLQKQFDDWKAGLDTKISLLVSQVSKAQSDIASTNQQLGNIQAQADRIQQEVSNIDWQSYIKTVNGVAPDENGNVNTPVTPFIKINGNQITPENDNSFDLNKSNDNNKNFVTSVNKRNADTDGDVTITMVNSLNGQSGDVFAIRMLGLNGNYSTTDADGVILNDLTGGKDIITTVNGVSSFNGSGKLTIDTGVKSVNGDTSTNVNIDVGVKTVNGHNSTNVTLTAQDLRRTSNQQTIEDALDVLDIKTNINYIKTINGTAPDMFGDFGLYDYNFIVTNPIDNKDTTLDQVLTQLYNLIQSK